VVAPTSATRVNDGLLDLVFVTDPDNSGMARTPDRCADRVFWNSGALGARANHWLRLRFSGIADARLIGTQVRVRGADGRLLGVRHVFASHAYKSGGALEAHFGLGATPVVDVELALPGGRTQRFDAVAADRFLDVDLGANVIRAVGAASR
jgi:hypothetical protein